MLSSVSYAEYAYEQVERQREQFKRLGVRADWDNPYITLEPAYEAQQIKVFGDMAKKVISIKDKTSLLVTNE